MKKATIKKKLCCYLICTVMAATGACTTSYALEGDGQSQGQVACAVNKRVEIMDKSPGLL